MPRSAYMVDSDVQLAIQNPEGRAVAIEINKVNSVWQKYCAAPGSMHSVFETPWGVVELRVMTNSSSKYDSLSMKSSSYTVNSIK